ncbi:hypothetical protein HWA97_gp67 [Clostridium phage CDKM9]|uniref:Uncharacterized protein n=2 Tax=root TaxID=1 RepID=A0A3G1E3D4_9CAUD|nr:hypothetical protein HWA97_gp67 [Clostridium phage CDKM9]EQG27156.1 putative phage protein [Clostridioides difficile DA00114]EQI29379.1 putative phage protein [Clostridioides difficile Y165]EQK57361.1 putative phage protein [Clostridioides difficile F548]ERM39092.1 putative phage protein [Clostridioides difficile P64]CCL48105.1 hypothetical protein BN179_1080004 [Clostridioides difficile T6]CDS85191.1 hypothetical protein BN1097_390003 [Clostridioides difficile]
MNHLENESSEHMTNKDMCKSKNLDEREVYKSFGKEICK